MDKYKVIKKLFVLGTVANIYMCYISYVKFSIYSEVSKNIKEKFE